MGNPFQEYRHICDMGVFDACLYEWKTLHAACSRLSAENRTNARLDNKTFLFGAEISRVNVY